MTSWTRLIRFTALETGGKKVHIGEPCDPALDVGLAVLNRQPVKAFEISGTSALDYRATVTKRVLTVQTLLSPVDPKEVGVARFLGLNYSDHAKENNLSPPSFPVLFYKPWTSLLDPFDPILITRAVQPPEVHLSDYECELVVILGRLARDVPESEALDYVLGYTGGNDVSFRKHQTAVPQFGFSKGFDASAPMGPVLVSAKAIRDPQTLGIKTVLNGQVLQDGNTRDMIFSVAQAIAFLSQGTTLLPGSVLWTGTPAGVGFARKPPVVLKHGDDVRVWVDGGIGTLVNPVEEEGKGSVRAKL
ncbi:hypothetical protein CALVIDRAFT_554130 [Calocera viscosa TUFC12733]|uniref:Fumarylacetoacetase-like C-terminal domain-containing protein n=1 Tax=Calocera viscosa (strain TUFC12733) TaxID=1330018 RepID=A0A167NTF2_CALVF|nr:hypothetical protein CALVIDRAFT_554130 [Calocera viscosa TUFC12733]